MSISYELAKKLKENGFPQKEAQSWEDINEASPWENYMNTRNTEGRHGTFDSSIIGYPETEPDFFEQGKYRPSARFKREYLDSEEGKRFTVYVPTLSELIEACKLKLNPTETILLEIHTDGAIARIHNYSWMSTGSTPEEAVALLYLELNKK